MKMVCWRFGVTSNACRAVHTLQREGLKSCEGLCGVEASEGTANVRAGGVEVGDGGCKQAEERGTRDGVH